MDNRHPLVSIVLCTYNGEQFLQEQLDSLISQTYKNLEIVIVDDNSKDGTKELLNSFAGQNSSVRLYFNEHNLGYNKNFEQAITLASGEYISICDQDDIWFPEKVNNLHNAIGDNWAVFSNSEYINFEGKPMCKRLLKGNLYTENYQGILLENFFSGHTSLLSRKCISHILPLPINGFYDWWIGFVCLYHKKLFFYNEVLTYYRIHENSVIRTKINSSIREQNVVVQLNNFLTYKNLQIRDHELISVIKHKLEAGRGLNGLWVNVFLNFETFFPKRTNQSIFSRLNFLRKFFKKE